MKIETGSKLVMIGDSITDCGRAQPVGEGLFGPWGNGYVNIVGGLLGAIYASRRVRLINMGTSGNTVRDLQRRWQTDVLDLAPDWLSIMIGINDVWRQFDSPLAQDHVGLEEYESSLTALVESVGSARVVLMTPFYIEPHYQDPMRKRMDEYGAAAMRVAAATGAIGVDTQAAFDHILSEYHPNALAWDRVHPNQIGHTVIARAFLDAIDFSWSPSD